MSTVTAELVSVIIPVFNVEKYLKKCVASVINNTYKAVEILLIDDGSTDNSGAICDELSQLDSRIIVYHKANGGQSSARNYGIEKAKGEYFFFVDSDDYISEICIEKLLAAMKTYNGELVYSKIKEVYDDNGKTSIADVAPKVMSGYDATAQVIEDKILSYVPGKLYKKELFDNIRFPEGRIWEDQAIMYKLFFAASKVVGLEDNIVFYRRQPESTSYKFPSKGLVHQFEAFYEQYFWVCENYPDLREYSFEKAVYCAVVACNQQARGYIIEKNIHDHAKDIMNRYIKKETRIHLNQKKRLQVYSILHFEKIYIFTMKLFMEIKKEHMRKSFE